MIKNRLKYKGRPDTFAMQARTGQIVLGLLSSHIIGEFTFCSWSDLALINTRNLLELIRREMVRLNGSPVVPDDPALGS